MEKKLNILIGILSIATFGAWIFNKKMEKLVIVVESYLENLERMGLKNLRTDQEKIQFLEDEIEYFGGYTHIISLKNPFRGFESYIKRLTVIKLLEELDNKNREIKISTNPKKNWKIIRERV